MWALMLDLFWIYTMFNSRVWQAARRRSKEERKIKQTEEKKTIQSKTQKKHRQDLSGRRICPTFQRKASGIIYCFVTQRCRVKGFSLMVLTYNLFHQYVKSNWHLLTRQRKECAVFLTCTDWLVDMLSDTTFRMQ